MQLRFIGSLGSYQVLELEPGVVPVDLDSRIVKNRPDIMELLQLMTAARPVHSTIAIEIEELHELWS